MREVDPGGPPWNDKHPGIPLSWKQIGAGGNAIVWAAGPHAIKRLKPNASKEPVARFVREAELMMQFAATSGLAIVPVVEVRQRAGELEIVMNRLGGSLASCIGEFAGQVEKAAAALLPIVETLAHLASGKPAIHHRDIKPENLLYRRQGGILRLAISDFGCAYLAEDERLTPTHRAIGAWAYRPPEYSIGRVIDVDEKGDVFSLGKVLWAMINGQNHVVFPGPVWFTDEFDLARRFPHSQYINHAMVLIAQACSINADSRPTLVDFAQSLRQISSPPTGARTEMDDQKLSDILRKEAKRDIEYKQRRAFAEQFVNSIHGDFRREIDALKARAPMSMLFREWESGTRAYLEFPNALVQQVAEMESDGTFGNVFFQKTILTTRFHPANSASPIRAVFTVEDQTKDPSLKSRLEILGTPEGMRYQIRYVDGRMTDGPYQRSVIGEFLFDAAQQLP